MTGTCDEPVEVELVAMDEWDPGEDPETSRPHRRWALRDIRYRDEPADGPHYGGVNWQARALKVRSTGRAS
jgi:hypothetical protein